MLLLAIRSEDTHAPRSMRTWLQRSQSQGEVIANDEVDQGRYPILRRHFSRDNERKYFLNFKAIFTEQIRRKHFVL